jgi:hypothetical protein
MVQVDDSSVDVENRSARGANITFSAEKHAPEPIILMKNDWPERV